jgi:uncharacterized protein YbjT (DUF2867 family)
MKLLLIGATGLVGSHVLHQALDDPRITEVIAPTRRTLPNHPKLFAPLIDFEQLPTDVVWWQVDAVICALGTTMKKAQSKEAFRRVDHDYPLAVARLARRQGTPTYVLNSALGADVGSRFFYSRVKGEVEQGLVASDFASLTLVRPGLISGNRPEFRLGERVAESVLTVLGPVLPKRWRVNPAERIATTLLNAAIQAQPGTRVIGSAALI